MMHENLDSESLVGRRLFGEYTVTRKLGEGGMGAVYLLQQDQIDQKIAVKVLHGRAAQSDELVQRFNREAKAVSMLNHPNITRLFIFGRSDDGLIYLAMEYVQGLSLREEFARGAMEEIRALKIMKQVLSALSEAHHMGIVHRDLKPDNIMLTEYRKSKDFVKVLDFGIAKVKEPQGGKKQQKLTQAGVVYGTPEYLSPEQAQALDLDHRTDVYSLGCILYEMITGEVPFSAPTAVTVLTMHVFEDPRPPSQVNPRCSPEMEKIILKAMAKKPADRYETAEAFLQALTGREMQLGVGADVAMPGQDILAASQALPKLDGPRPGRGGDNSASLAKTQVFDAAAAERAASRAKSDEDEAQAQTMRKVLIGLIAVCAILLVALIGAIFMVWYVKSGGGG